MKFISHPKLKRLAGTTILLSASVPSPGRAGKYRRDAGAQFAVDQAVMSLARTVFSGGGALVFGGHPSISPLVTTVAGEYRQPVFVESATERPQPVVHIYQSRAFEGYVPDETLIMFQLNVATIVWTDAVGDERFDPKEAQDEHPCPKSLLRMRTTMINDSKPDAMVCIGGMEGVEDEAKLFSELMPHAPIYPLETTGGAAEIIARHDRRNTRLIDREVIDMFNRQRKDSGSEQAESNVSDERARISTPPYPLIMQVIVDDLLSRRSRDGQKNGE